MGSASPPEVIEQCFASAVRRWQFPQGKTQVEYAFALSPGEPRNSGFTSTRFGGLGAPGAASYVLTDRKSVV